MKKAERDAPAPRAAAAAGDLSLLEGPLSSPPEGPAFPWVRVAFALLAVVPEGLSESVILPFAYRFLQGLHTRVPGERDNTGLYLGLFFTAFNAPLIVMNTVWGGASDSIGRRRILMAGCAGLTLGSLALGFSQTLVWALAWRVFCGIFVANSTITKGYLGETLADQHLSLGYSLYGAIFGLTSLLGPLIGGGLSALGGPPGHPFLWPFIFNALTAAGVCVVTGFCLKESSRFPARQSLSSPTPRSAQSYSAIPLSPTQFHRPLSSPTLPAASPLPRPRHSNVQHKPPVKSPIFAILTSKRTLLPLLLYMLVTFLFYAWQTLFPLFLSVPAPNGLGLGPAESGVYLGFYGLCKLFWQLGVFPFLINLPNWGVKASVRLGLILVIPAVLSLPFLGAALQGSPGSYWARMVVFFTIQALVTFGDVFGYLGVIMWISRTSLANASTGSPFADDSEIEPLPLRPGKLDVAADEGSESLGDSGLLESHGSLATRHSRPRSSASDFLLDPDSPGPAPLSGVGPHPEPPPGTRASLGLLHGLSSTFSCVSRMGSPMISGWVWSLTNVPARSPPSPATDFWSLPGLVPFACMVVVALVGICMVLWSERLDRGVAVPDHDIEHDEP